MLLHIYQRRRAAVDHANQVSFNMLVIVHILSYILKYEQLKDLALGSLNQTHWLLQAFGSDFMVFELPGHMKQTKLSLRV